MTSSPHTHRFGFVSIIGPTNAGKSTFLNKVIGYKLSIVTPKVQTTRSRVIGLRIVEESQIAFIDTPGLFKPKRQFDEAMIEAAIEAPQDSDINLFFIDATDQRVLMSEVLTQAFERLKMQSHKTYLVINKIDRIEKAKLLTMIQKLNDQYPFEQSFLISSLTGEGVDDLLDFIAQSVPVGDWMYDENELSTISKQFYAAEVTREKLFLRLRQEIPYALSVVTEEWEDKQDGSVVIKQMIYVGKESHKSIVLGHKGAFIKDVGQAARKDISAFLECPVHLFLFVKVNPKWDEEQESFEHFGLVKKKKKKK